MANSLTDLYPLIAAFTVIGLAELGDKTQLLTFGFATRFSFWKIMAAVLCASGILMGVAVVFGGLINYYLPSFYVQLLAGSLFLFFGLYTIFSKEKEEQAGDGGRSQFAIVFTSFFLAELGDKTQLATLALSAKYGTPFLVWLGATLAMTIVNGLGILAGRGLKKVISENSLRLAGAGMFIVFGLWTFKELFF